MTRLSTFQRPPGVYVIDERPLSRPMTQASLGGCAMICQLTLAEPGWQFDPVRHILPLNSFDDFVGMLGGQSFVAELAIKSGFQLAPGGTFVTADGQSTAALRPAPAAVVVPAAPAGVAAGPAPAAPTAIPAPTGAALGAAPLAPAPTPVQSPHLDHLTKLFTEIRDEAQKRREKNDAQLRITTGKLVAKATGPEVLPDSLKWLFPSTAGAAVPAVTVNPPSGALAGAVALTPDTLGPIAVAYWSIYGFFANGGDRLYVVDVPWAEQTPATLKTVLKALRGDDYQFGLICAPGQGAGVQNELVAFCGVRDTDSVGEGGEPFCVAVLDANNPAVVPTDANVPVAHNRDDSGSTSAAMYWPWLHVADTRRPKKLDQAEAFAPLPVVMPPSVFVAGLISRTDAGEGPHRAPAGMDKPVRGCLGLSAALGDVLAGQLNEKGVNCLREFTAGTPVVFGCRTLSTDPNYKYVPVSRVLMSVRKTVKQQLRWAVHRPNTDSLRKSIKRDIEALLERMRREGQLAGEKPEQAYKVVVSDDRADQKLGILKVRVEVAPTYPAEFIIVEVAQMVGA